MNEAEWLASNDPLLMLELINSWLRRRNIMNTRIWAPVSERKLRLFGLHLWIYYAGICQYTLLENNRNVKKDFDWIDGKINLETSDFWNLQLKSASEFASGAVDDYIIMPSRHKDLLHYKNFSISLDMEWAAQLLRCLVGNPWDNIRSRSPLLLCSPACVNCLSSGKILRRGLYPDQAITCTACAGRGHGPCPYFTPLVKSIAQTAYDDYTNNCFLKPEHLNPLHDLLVDAGMPVEFPCYGCDGKGKTELLDSLQVARTVFNKQPCVTCNGTGKVSNPLLEHLKKEFHVRGDWAVDLILDQE